MFAYAFARMLIEQYGSESDPLVANFKRCGSSAYSSWGDSLQYFNVKPYTTDNADLILKYGSFRQRLSYLVYMLWTRLPLLGKSAYTLNIEQALRRIGLHFTGAADAAYPLVGRCSREFVRGYFQDRRFFSPIRSQLLHEFTPKQPPLRHNEGLYEQALRSDSVCVSVRRGDYLSEQYRKDFHVCTPDYYRAAFKAVTQRIAHPVFIFFSDDIAWVRENMTVEGFPCYYERGDDPVWETLRLMYSCHHFIISNSTFAWWAQYLGNREGKLVVCPSSWFANPDWHSNLVNDDFIFINT